MRIRARVGVRVELIWAGLGLGGDLFPHTHACNSGLSGMRFNEGEGRSRASEVKRSSTHATNTSISARYTPPPPHVGPLSLSHPVMCGRSLKLALGLGNCNRLTRTQLLCQKERGLKKQRENDGWESCARKEGAQRVLYGPDRGDGGYWRGCGGCGRRSTFVRSVYTVMPVQG